MKYPKNAIRKNNTFNSGTQHIGNDDENTFITLFIKGALIDSRKVSRFFSIGFDIFLLTCLNLPLVIPTKSFEIINSDQRIQTIKLDK